MQSSTISVTPASNTGIRPFRIEIAQACIDELNDRLAWTRWNEELRDVGWRYGVPPARVKELVEYLQSTYDWREHEQRLNELSQFAMTIDGSNVRFVQTLAGIRSSAAAKECMR